MPTFTFDGVEVPFEKGEDILTAALRAKESIPHYCYHPGFSRVATCRMCLVDIVDAGNGRGMPKLQASCATPAADGMKVVSKNEKVKDARESVLEFLLVNHPLDCPICDQSGECTLQDYSFNYGSGKSTMESTKRLYGWRDIGSFLQLERNRCIHCTRCVRFTQEITETSEMGMFQRNHQLTVDTFVDKPLTDLFQGNLADVCPVGAITSKDFRFKKRVWKLNKVSSVCTGCSTGCNINVHQYQGTIHRFTPRENQDVNRWWMCDLGRTGFHPYLDAEKRQNGCEVDGKPVEWKEALTQAAEKIKNMQLKKDECVIVGSNHSTLEELHLIKDFASKHLPEASFYGPDAVAADAPKDVWVENLITSDKSPNAKGLELLGFQNKDAKAKLQKIKWDRVKCLIVINDSGENIALKDAMKQAKYSVLITTLKSDLSKVANVTIAGRSHLEKTGSFVNKEERIQLNRSASKAFPKSKDGLEIFYALSNAIAKEETPMLSAKGYLKKLVESNDKFQILRGTTLSSLGTQL